MSSFLLRRAATTTARSFSTSASKSSFAKMTIVGRLGDTPEAFATSTGKDILKYSVATSSGPKDNQKTSWFKVTCFASEGSQKEFISGLEKGTMVYVEGDVTVNQFQDAEGVNKKDYSIVQRRLEVLARKRQQESEM